MPPIATYAFFDLGTTGLLDTNPDITEMHMTAIKCNDLAKYFRAGKEESVAEPPANKILHCRLDDGVMFLIGGENVAKCDLEEETIAFLENLEKPICLIAHNGNRLDFPLLQAKLIASGLSPKDIVCADSMAAFYDIMEPNPIKTSCLERKSGSFPWPNYHFDKGSYGLKDLFKRIYKGKAVLENAKDRNDALVQIAMDFGFEFMWWVAENNQPLATFCM